jgi:hypothetical protein
MPLNTAIDHRQAQDDPDPALNGHDFVLQRDPPGQIRGGSRPHCLIEAIRPGAVIVDAKSAGVDKFRARLQRIQHGFDGISFTPEIAFAQTLAVEAGLHDRIRAQPARADLRDR